VFVLRGWHVEQLEFLWFRNRNRWCHHHHGRWGEHRKHSRKHDDFGVGHERQHEWIEQRNDQLWFHDRRLQ
jgi:hypothetical protein